MGKIKGRLIKRTSEKLIKNNVEFTEDFNKNKKILGDSMPSKKIRNQMAGYLARLKRQENISKKELEAPLSKNSSK